MKKCTIKSVIYFCAFAISVLKAKAFLFIAAPENPDVLNILSSRFFSGFSDDIVEGLLSKLNKEEVAFHAIYLPYILDPANVEHGEGASIEMVFDSDNLQEANLGFYILQRPDDDGNPVRHFLGVLVSSEIAGISGIVYALGSGLFPKYQNLIANLQMKYAGIADPSLFALQDRIDDLRRPFAKYLESGWVTRAFVGAAQRMLDKAKEVSAIQPQKKIESPSTPPTTDSPRSSSLDSSGIISL